MSKITESAAKRKQRKNEDRKLELLMAMYHKLSLRKITEIALAYDIITPNIGVRNFCAAEPEATTENEQKA